MLVNLFSNKLHLDVLGWWTMAPESIYCTQVSESPPRPTHSNTAKDTQINVRRHFEAERQRHHGEVEGVDAVDLFERVRVVSPHVGLVGFLGRLVEIVVLLDQLLQLKDKKKEKSAGHLNLNVLLKCYTPKSWEPHLRLDV